MAVKMEIGEGKATVEREIEGAHEVWETSLPAVISAQKGLNEPRYASLKGIMSAKKKTVDVKSAAALGLKPEDLKPKTRVVGLERRRGGVKMIGDADAGEGAVAAAPPRRGTLMATIVTSRSPGRQGPAAVAERCRKHAGWRDRWEPPCKRS
jgi:electron transfer flavoprotein alpha/beta subunit